MTAVEYPLHERFLFVIRPTFLLDGRASNDELCWLGLGELL
jgi:hypothetical protein